MAASELSYFTCTLSEALAYNIQKGARLQTSADGTLVSNDFFEDINGFIDFLASRFGQQLALGYVIPKLNSPVAGHLDIQEELLSFEDVRGISIRLGQILKRQLGKNAETTEWIALLATSSSLFLLVWLGLLRYGYKVLLIAPQSSPKAIQHLVKVSNATAIIHDAQHEAVIGKILGGQRDNASVGLEDRSAQGSSVRCIKLSWMTTADALNDIDVTDGVDLEESSWSRGRPVDIAYSFHSSGTTGLPKMIPQTNHGAVGVLPLLQDTSSSRRMYKGSFSTTPLYSGGIADVLRSWSAASPFWLFPEGHMPITGSNILACIRKIDDLCWRSDKWPSTSLNYLSCVPFVLEAMMELPDAMARLRNFDMVGVGGAAMPKHLGDEAVETGISLVSRFGSSENGFLLSSNRDFANDKQWDVLRCSETDCLDFKKLEGYENRFELIISSAWPLVSTASHAQRPFNTHDVFVPYPHQNGLWYYKGRSDAQLTLRTGRKFDPSEMEASIRASDAVRDVVVVGEGQAVPAALIFVDRDGTQMKHADLDPAIRSAISNANLNLAKYAQLDWRYVKLLHANEALRIPKNNKGGVIRSTFLEEFASEIRETYDECKWSENETVEVDVTSCNSILLTVETIVKQQLQPGGEVSLGSDFFEAGLDSQGCISICQRLKACTGIKALHLGTIYECGSVEKLANYIAENLGLSVKDNFGGTSEASKLDEMRSLVDEYVRLQPQLLNCTKPTTTSKKKCSPKNPGSKNVLLTGATGFLGVHILGLLLQDDLVDRIFVFIRGSHLSAAEEQETTARARIEAAMSFHSLNSNDIRVALDRKIAFIPFFLKHDSFGISHTVRGDIIDNVTHIIHAAWEVNFNLPLKAFANHVKGVVSFFNLAVLAGQRQRQRISYTFCSSIASIQNIEANDFSSLCREVSRDPQDAATIGYGQSKWVAEQVLHILSKQSTNIGISLLRVGQLSGDTQRGIWSRREAWPLMIDASLHCIPAACKGHEDKDSSRNLLCIFPDLASTDCGTIDWLPVNHAASAVVNRQIVTGNAMSSTCVIDAIINQEHKVNWKTAQTYVRDWAAERGYKYDTIPAQEWLDRLESTQQDHQAKALIPLWRKNWSAVDKVQPGEANGQMIDPTTCEVSFPRTSNLRDEAILTRDYFERLLTWIDTSGDGS